MKVKQLLTIGLAGTLLVGTIATSSAAELDFAWYAKQNPDVVAEVGDSPEALKLHYDMYGRKEARMANTKDVEAQLRKLFKVDEYAKLYPDVKEFYGEDAEAMFMHYLSFGLLEARRPSEKVSQAAANSLKQTVEKAMTDAGLEATPGSVELVAVITGETETLAAAKPEIAVDSAQLEKVTAAIEQVAPVVEKAVEVAAEATTAPASKPSSGGGGSSSSSQTTTQTTANTVTANDFATLKTAISDGNANVSIKLVGNVNVASESVVIPKGKSVTIDLNGYTVSGDAGVPTVTVSGGLTVKNSGSSANIVAEGTTSGTSYAAAIQMYDGSRVKLETKVAVSSNNSFGLLLGNGSKLEVDKGAKVCSGMSVGPAIMVGIQSLPGKAFSGTWPDNINDIKPSEIVINGTVEGKMYGMNVNGMRYVQDVITVDRGVILARGETYSSNKYGIALFLGGESVVSIVNKSNVVGYSTGIEVRAGTLGIEDSSVAAIGTGVTYDESLNMSGTTVDGAALAVSKHTSDTLKQKGKQFGDLKVTVGSGVTLSTASSDGVVMVVTDQLATGVTGDTLATIKCGIEDTYKIRTDDMSKIDIVGDKVPMKQIELRSLDGINEASEAALDLDNSDEQQPAYDGGATEDDNVEETEEGDE